MPLLRTALLTALGTSSLAALAQSSTPPATLQAVEVRSSSDYVQESTHSSLATRSDQHLLDVSQSVQVVGPSALQDQQVRSLDEALQHVSGITQGSTRAGTQDAFVRRGFSAESTGGVLRDGVRSMQARNFSATTEQVEVLKGPASTLYGIQEPGGVINVVSKLPLERHHTQVQLEGMQAGGYAAQFDHTAPLVDSDWSYRLVASTEQRDDWRNFGRHRRDLVAPSLAWRSGGTEFTVAYEHSRYDMPFDDGTLLSNGRPLDIPRERRLSEPLSRMAGSTDFTTVRLQQALNAQWTARATLAHNRHRYDDWRVRANSYNADTGLLRRRVDGRQGVDDQSSYAVADLLGKFQAAGLQHELLLGVDHEHTTNRTAQEFARLTVSGFNPFDPVYGQVALPTATNPEANQGLARLRTSAVFVQDSITLSPRWIVSAALRYQRYQQYEGAGDVFTVSQESRGSQLLPRLGLVYKLSPSASLYANYATSFVPNVSSNPSQGSFAPTQGRSFELGSKWALGERFAGTVALFDIEKRNIVVNLDEDTARAIGKARARGLELDVAAQIGRAVRLVGSYAYTDTQVLEDAAGLQGNRLPDAARHQASLGVHATPGWRTDDLVWHVQGSLRYVGERAGDEANSFDLPAYTVADLGLGTQFDWDGTQLRLDLLLRNAFDKTYYPSADGAMRLAVGEPRNFSVRLSATF